MGCSVPSRGSPWWMFYAFAGDATRVGGDAVPERRALHRRRAALAARRHLPGRGDGGAGRRRAQPRSHARGRRRASRRADPRVRLLDNPRGATPVALNIGVRAARGDVIVRADAHSELPARLRRARRCARSTRPAPTWSAPRSRPTPADDDRRRHSPSRSPRSPFATGARFRYRREERPRRRGAASAAGAARCSTGSACSTSGSCATRTTSTPSRILARRRPRAPDRRRVHRATTRARRCARCGSRRARPAPGTPSPSACIPYTFRWRHFLPGAVLRRRAGRAGARSCVGGRARRSAPGAGPAPRASRPTWSSTRSSRWRRVARTRRWLAPFVVVRGARQLPLHLRLWASPRAGCWSPPAAGATRLGAPRRRRRA